MTSLGVEPHDSYNHADSAGQGQGQGQSHSNFADVRVRVLEYDSVLLTMTSQGQGQGHIQFCWRQVRVRVRLYRVAPKMATFLEALTSSNINRFSKLFHCQNQEKICNNTITKDPTTPQVCRYTTFGDLFFIIHLYACTRPQNFPIPNMRPLIIREAPDRACGGGVLPPALILSKWK